MRGTGITIINCHNILNFNVTIITVDTIDRIAVNRITRLIKNMYIGWDRIIPY